MEFSLPMHLLYTLPSASSSAASAERSFVIPSSRAATSSWRTSMMLIVLRMAGVLGTSMLVCRPISGFWDPENPKAKCIVLVAGFETIGILDVGIDAMIFLLPMSMGWQLQIPLVDKVGVVSLFALGLITISAGALGTYAVSVVHINDLSFYMVCADIGYIIEVGAATIISSCALRAPRVRPRLWLSGTVRRGSWYSGNECEE
ncbi:hypothetical protein EJ06DRAFT_255899 [Trichodelitschia bisporula]|uniref:Rhodopsin domain-containing protein n=1 Tax=Trichodelitschia bisporula TaxID=703511 RepID=A0A6G1HIZ0_9PEZI|nr:hypothetical protein EJ06DRAFT_255899 [Trichodelitschia bisporula]